MNKILTLCFVFVTIEMFSQIEEKPINYKKINFVYETKSNYFIDENGIYADSLLIKLDFPEIKFTTVNELIENKNYNSFIPLKHLKGSNIKKLCGILYHTNQKFIGEYDAEKNETNYRIERNDELTKKIFKNILKERYSNFFYKKVIKFSKNKIHLNYPSVNYTFTITEKAKNIIMENQVIGRYKEVVNNIEFSNVVLLNINLDSKIMPDDFFTNNNYGVEVIKKLNATTILKSVKYY
ncbi:hypothetical protein [Flavobacterium sp.]|uniref:hypothetical protein n=1 Tax=Flavobacterium sp. TaxID=239 RepID=UPI0025E71EEB|nr:hypothetical protein [Flavobacterium sp.]